MKLVFAGTPDFAAEALRALLEAGHEVVQVLTQPDRPAGRGMTLKPSAVKSLALAAGIPVFQPETLKTPEVQERLRTISAEVMVVAAYGLILPRAVLEMYPLGCLNIHASLLPRWRGAAPIQRAILSGDSETGICIMRMEAGLDTGPILQSERLSITSTDTAGVLHDKLAKMGGRLIVATLAHPFPTPMAQSSEGVTYAHKIEKSEAVLNWYQPAEMLSRCVRAFNPFPGAVTTFRHQPLKIWSAEVVSGAGVPGTLLDGGRRSFVVACGRDALRVLELQKAGGKRLSAANFLAGISIEPGENLE